MLTRLFARFRRRPRDYSPRHALAAPAPAPARRVAPPPPPPPPPLPEPTVAIRPDIQILPDRLEPASSKPVEEGYEAGDARVSFVLRDGSLARPVLDAETASHMDHVVRSLLDNDAVRRTT